MKEFEVTRTYKVQISDEDLMNISKWAVASALSVDQVIRDLVEEVTYASDGGDLRGSMYLYLQDMSSLASYWWSDNRLGCTAEPIMSIGYEVDHPDA